MQRCLSVRCIPVFIRGRVREPADIQFSAGATMLRAKTTTSNTCIMDCKISFMSFCDSLLSIQYNNILYWFIPWRSKSPSPSSQTRERAHSQQDLWKVKKKRRFYSCIKTTTSLWSPFSVSVHWMLQVFTFKFNNGPGMASKLFVMS